MKLLVINIALRPPPARKSLPLGLGYVVSAIKRAGFELDLLDLDASDQTEEQTEQFLRTHRYDVVAMGCIVTGYKHVKWLSETVKKAFPSTVVIVGNTVAQSIPSILLNRTAADIAVMGEADETIVELLNCIREKGDLKSVRGISYKEKNELIVTKPRPVIENIDSIPFPDWSLFNIEVYISSQTQAMMEYIPESERTNVRVMPINTARGCPFKCTFCYRIFRNERYRWRSAESIVEEMRSLHKKYNINFFNFFDELTFFSIPQAERFADVLMASGLNVYWTADCRSGLFVNKEHGRVAGKLKKAGCLWLGFALESAAPEILKWMDKKVGVDAFTHQVRILKQVGLRSFTSLVLGYPNETPETIKTTIDCCIANEIYPSAGYLLPQPGSPMYDYALQHGYIKDEESYLLAMGDRQDLRLNMTSMSDAQLEDIVKKELARCSRELGLNLSAGTLLKTGHFRTTKSKKGE